MTIASAPITVVAYLSVAPIGILGGVQNATTALVYWTDNANDETGYRIEVSVLSDNGVTYSAFSTLVDKVRSATQSNATGGIIGYYTTIAAPNRYKYRVSAYKASTGLTTYSTSGISPVMAP